MKKNEFNEKFREYARSLSPTITEQDLVTRIYSSINDILGEGNCLQIGSYPRHTSITPLHDLDILYILGEWNENSHDQSNTLQVLLAQLKIQYENPTDYAIEISLQTHSVTISYKDDVEEILSVDIVPAYIYGKNKFNLDTYKVPELIKKKSHVKRREFYEKLRIENKAMDWITSDPRGYIKVASELDKITSGEFRKTVKVVKKWKDNLEKKDKELKLKSFHIEQVVTRYFQERQDKEIFDAVLKFFIELPEIMNNPNRIPDRANADKFIDDYLEKFTIEQKEKIKQVRDGFLQKLESLDEEDSIETLLEILSYTRKSASEQFLFDSNIPILKEKVLTINAWIQKDNRDFRRLNALGVIDKGLHIRFEVFMPIICDLYKWKVKNDDNSPQPRGEITDNHTYHDPESTKYKGKHFVECYAIKNGVCIAVARQNVTVLH